MPFATLRMPSIQLGLLHAAVKDAGLSVKTFNFNIELLRFIDALSSPAQQEHNFDFLRASESRVTAAHTFAVATAPLFGEATPAWPHAPQVAPDWEEPAMLVRRVFPDFLEHCAKTLLA